MNLTRAPLAAGISVAFAAAAMFWVFHSPSQEVDPDFDPRIRNPAYASRHPVVLFDEEWSKGLYKPFLDLVRNDGYRVLRATGPVMAADLKGVDIFAVPIVMGFKEGQKTLPGLRHDLKGDACSPEECRLLSRWVNDGGSLLVASDYAPTARSAAALVALFGVKFLDGWAIEPVNHDPASGRQGFVIFTRANGQLAEHEVTRGVSRVMSFTGQAMSFPANATGFLRLSPNALLIPYREDQSKAQPTPAPAAAQGVALESGKGRVVVLGDATMITAVKLYVNGVANHLGMSRADVDNRRLALNIMHWLSHFDSNR